MKYADMHCDTLMEAYFAGRKSLLSVPEAMTDIGRLCQGECMMQFFAIFLPCADIWEWYGRTPVPDEEYLEGCRQIYVNTLSENGDLTTGAGTYEDIRCNEKEGRMTAVLTLEDGRCVQGSMERLEHLYRDGVRMIGLTWNAHNCFGAPNSRDVKTMSEGLTHFGREAVRYMNCLGMAVDVSHLSDGGFYDVASISEKPFVASHSNCRALCGHPRNLSDDMLRVLGEKGGVTGLNFGPEFLNDTPGNEHSSLEAMSVHVRHVIQVGGLECAAIGTDFDGIAGELDIGSADQMQSLFWQLHKDGLTEGQIEKIAYKNVLRVFGDIWN